MHLSNSKGGQKKPIMPKGSFYKPKFFDFMKEEFHACREGVGIIDMSSFSKIEIKVSNSWDDAKPFSLSLDKLLLAPPNTHHFPGNSLILINILSFAISCSPVAAKWWITSNDCAPTTPTCRSAE